MNIIILNKPHTHAGIRHQSGAELILSEIGMEPDSAAWLAESGIASWKTELQPHEEPAQADPEPAQAATEEGETP